MSDKNAYQEKMQAKIDEWKAEIDKLKAQAAQKGAEGKQEYGKMIESLENQHLNAQSKLAGLKERSQGAWEDLKIGIDNAISELGQSFQKVTGHFNSK